MIEFAIFVEDSPHSMTITEVLDSFTLSLGGKDNFPALMFESPVAAKPSINANKNASMVYVSLKKAAYCWHLGSVVPGRLLGNKTTTTKPPPIYIYI